MFSFLRKPKPQAPAPQRRLSFFSTQAANGESFPAVPDILAEIKSAQPALDARYAQDDSSDGYPQFKALGAGGNTVSDALIGWYASQGFIGHQLCGILAQHWLINKVCSMPGSDAIRKGYSIVSEDGDDIPEEAAKILKRMDRQMRVNQHMREFVRKGRIFGIRIAMFRVDSTDAEYYEKPFNIDGVTPKSYKGIVQIDPYWVAPMLDQASASQPDSMHFYEPTHWMINGRKVHRSHLIIFRHAEPVDILKPQYLYGGVPLPQQIMERVYAAESTANEAPQLAQSKRTTVWLTDIEAFMADANNGGTKMSNWVATRNNYGLKVGDKEGDEMQQFDTALSDLDAVIMSQYQLVAAQAGVPATKLLGTTPKGFNATGEYEESNYHELLESLQEDDLTPFLERHHALVMKAYVEPAVPEAVGLQTSVNWNPLDTPTAKELADTNLVKAQTGAALIGAGVIDSEEERRRVAMDKTSGYNEMGLEDTPAPEPEPEPDAPGAEENRQ